MKNYMNFYSRRVNETVGIATEEKVWRTPDCINEVPLEFGSEIVYDNLDEDIHAVNGEFSFENFYYDAEYNRFICDRRNGYLGSSVFNQEEYWVTVEQAQQMYNEYYSGYTFEES